METQTVEITDKKQAAIDRMANARAAKKVNKEFEDRMADKKEKLSSGEIEPKIVSTPWKPAKVLDIPADMKDSRYTYRWVSKSRVGNVQKKLQEGWEIDHTLAKRLDEKFGLNKTLEDAKQQGTVIHMREMILMRMPKQMAKERNEYYMKRGNISTKEIKGKMGKDALASRDSKDGKFGDDTVLVYGDVTETKSI